MAIFPLASALRRARSEPTSFGSYVQGSIPFLELQWQGRTGLESFHASPCAHFPLRASGDYHSRHDRSPVFVLVGIPADAALVIEHDGPAADSILALARETTKSLTGVNPEYRCVETRLVLSF